MTTTIAAFSYHVGFGMMEQSIIAASAAVHGVSVHDMTLAKVSGQLTMARQVVVYLLDCQGYSTKQCAEVLHRGSPSAALAMLDSIEIQLTKSDTDIRQAQVDAVRIVAEAYCGKPSAEWPMMGL